MADGINYTIIQPTSRVPFWIPTFDLPTVNGLHLPNSLTRTRYSLEEESAALSDEEWEQEKRDKIRKKSIGKHLVLIGKTRGEDDDVESEDEETRRRYRQDLSSIGMTNGMGIGTNDAGMGEDDDGNASGSESNGRSEEEEEEEVDEDGDGDGDGTIDADEEGERDLDASIQDADAEDATVDQDSQEISGAMEYNSASYEVQEVSQDSGMNMQDVSQAVEDVSNAQATSIADSSATSGMTTGSSHDEDMSADEIDMLSR